MTHKKIGVWVAIVLVVESTSEPIANLRARHSTLFSAEQL